MPLLRWGPKMLLSSVLFLAVLMGPASSPAQAGPVQVDILVIEASKKGSGYDPKLDAAKLSGQLKDAGFPKATVLDALQATVEPDAQVSLQIRGMPEKSRMLTVKVLEVQADGTIRLRLAMPDFKFSADTTHKKGGTILVAHKRGADEALFLAVTPHP